MSAFPADDVLILRGKYATIASERRRLLKDLRDDMESLSDRARLCVRSLHTPEEAAAELLKAQERLAASKGRMLALCAVEGQLDELRPLAWGKEQRKESLDE